MTEIELFRQAVERFLSVEGITPTEFGKRFASDPKFVFDLRRGREPRTETRQKILLRIFGPAPEQDAAQ